MNSELRTVWVTVRTDAALYDDLAKAARVYHISQSEIARMALRKAERLRPDLAAATKKLGSTYQGGMLRLEIERGQQRWADQLRAVLRWYLDRPTQPVAGLTLDEGRYMLGDLDKLITGGRG